MDKLSSEQLAYIAGIVDGEGYISVVRRNCKNTKCGLFYYAQLVVVNTSEELIDWLWTTTNLGSVHLQRKKNKEHKHAFRWTLTTKGAESLVRLIVPYLVCKKKQALLLLEFCQNNKRPGRSSLSEEELSYRAGVYRQLRILNKKGRSLSNVDIC